MPFIGVRISWLMAARKRDLARLAASACLRASLSSASARRSSVISRPRHCTSGRARFAHRHGVLFPLEPAWTGGGVDLLYVALLPQCASGCQRRRRVAGQDPVGEGAAEHLIPLETEDPTERLIDETQPALGVAAQDHVGLIVEQIPVAGFVFPDLPLQILELLQAAFEALTNAHKTVEGLGKVVRQGRRALAAPTQGEAQTAGAQEPPLQRLQ